MPANRSRLPRIVASLFRHTAPKAPEPPRWLPRWASLVSVGCVAALLTACTEDASGGAPSDLDDFALSPLLVLSEHIGDVGLEAISAGLPVRKDRQSFEAAKGGILYVDVDSVKESDFRAVFDLVHSSLQAGGSAVIETSEFDFDKMHGIVASEFPMIDRSTIEDVAVLLRPEAGTVTALRIDPSELAMHGGVEFADTTAGRMRSLAQGMSRSASLGAGYYDPINFAMRAYDAAPGTQGNWQLRHNGTYVDVWKTAPGVNPGCYVAWRGTDTSNFWDVWADGSSQFASAIRIDNQENNTTLRGGRGFVNRLHAYDDVVNQRLRDLNCPNVQITGHSLGGAVSQLHGIQLAFNSYWKTRLLAVDAWNSPNVVTTATRTAVVTRFNTLGNLWSINCRRNDLIVNSVPTGLVRLGPANSEHVGGCTHVSPQRSRLGTSNHSMEYWLDELD